MENHQILPIFIDNFDVSLLQSSVLLNEQSSIMDRYWPYQQKCCPRNRILNFFELTVPSYRDDQFKEHFRMSRVSFEVLLNIVGEKTRDLKEPIANVPLKKKLLYTIWLISKQESFLAVGDRFDIAKSSGHIIFKFIVTLLSKIMPSYVNWPNESQQTQTEIVFQQRSRGIPGVIGAIDGCHIPIKQPVGNATDYFNRKQIHSVILQGVCDSSGYFVDVFIGQPGRMHDARVFKTSPLYRKLTNNICLRADRHLIGDSAYPLLTSLMTPFRDNGHLSESHILYNTRLNSIRSIIERAFGVMKSKFRRLKYLDVSSPALATLVISAACMLHNFMLTRGEFDLNEEYSVTENEDVTDCQYAQNTEGMVSSAVRKREFIVNLL